MAEKLEKQKAADPLTPAKAHIKSRLNHIHAWHALEHGAGGTGRGSVWGPSWIC